MSKNGVPFNELASPGEVDRKLGTGTGAIHKGWSSERVPSTAAGPVTSRRPSANAGGPLPPPFSPFNSGRTLPSKWEDAERWICSPVSGPYRNSQLHHQRNSYSNRPKSKSGPLGQPGAGYGYGYAGNFSPAFLVGSPFSTGVIVADEALLSCVGGGNENNGEQSQCLSRVGSCYNAPAASGGYGYSVEKHDGAEDTENGVSRAVSRRDMATQMSPKSSICSSPKARTSLCPSAPSSPPAKLEVRDVLMDKRSNVISWSKRHAARIARKGWIGVDGSNDIEQRPQASTWDMGDAKNMSRSQREEAKIAAWENLQRAKAEAAIRKLEMKLEKKRSSSMDRILNKLRRAELKAQEMRRSSISEDYQDSKPSNKRFRVKFLPSCFGCHPFIRDK